jgi:hypothetical protein
LATIRVYLKNGWEIIRRKIMSKMRKEAIRAIETLDSSELLMVYDMILSLKRTRAFEKSKEKTLNLIKRLEMPFVAAKEI